jgi:hypothetical protein
MYFFSFLFNTIFSYRKWNGRWIRDSFFFCRFHCCFRSIFVCVYVESAFSAQLCLLLCVFLFYSFLHCCILLVILQILVWYCFCINKFCRVVLLDERNSDLCATSVCVIFRIVRFWIRFCCCFCGCFLCTATIVIFAGVVTYWVLASLYTLGMNIANSINAPFAKMNLNSIDI